MFESGLGSSKMNRKQTQGINRETKILKIHKLLQPPLQSKKKGKTNHGYKLMAKGRQKCLKLYNFKHMLSFWSQEDNS